MSATIYCYKFDPTVDPLEVEATLVLAILATEALHGEVATRLGISHCFDATERACIIDAEKTVGHDFNAVFLGFIQREFGPQAFRVEQLANEQTPTAAIAA